MKFPLGLMITQIRLYFAGGISSQPSYRWADSFCIKLITLKKTSIEDSKLWEESNPDSLKISVFVKVASTS